MKFRVWDNFNKCYLETEDGLWFKERLLEEDGFNLAQSINLSEILCEPEPGQERQYFAEIFTETFDKDGKEIYIGDVVERTAFVGTETISAAAAVETFLFGIQSQNNQVKVISNIHQYGIQN
jgi:hypothetical protein